jgi:hypothetical protein
MDLELRSREKGETVADCLRVFSLAPPDGVAHTLAASVRSL